MKKLSILIIFSLLCSYPSFSAQAQEKYNFGINVSPKLVKPEMKYAEKLGIGILRIPLSWQIVEPRPGEFDWAKTDSVVEAAAKKDIAILFTLRVISSWGTKQEIQKTGIYRSASSPKDLNQWVHFVKSLAHRYKDYHIYYEIDNEVNGKAFWRGTKKEYTQLLKASYAAIKEVAPNTKVLASAVACGITKDIKPNMSHKFKESHDSWLRAILATKSFDVVSVHNYYFPSEISANGLTFGSYLRHIQKLMQEEGVSNKPIWITEIGYISRPTKVGNRTDRGSPQKQAKWLKESYQQSYKFGVDKIFWLLTRDRNEAYFGSMGLMDENNKPRPASKVLKQLIEQ